MKTIKIAGVSGSLRKRSYNTAILRAAQSIVPEGARVDVVDIANLPLYNEDLREEGRFPAPVHAFIETIRAADAVLFQRPSTTTRSPAF